MYSYPIGDSRMFILDIDMIHDRIKFHFFNNDGIRILKNHTEDFQIKESSVVFMCKKTFVAIPKAEFEKIFKILNDTKF